MFSANLKPKMMREQSPRNFINNEVKLHIPQEQKPPRPHAAPKKENITKKISSEDRRK